MKNLKDLFIPYETGIPTLAKEKGFNEECFGYYWNWDSHNFSNGSIKNVQLHIKEGMHPFYKNNEQYCGVPYTSLEKGKTYHCTAPIYQQIDNFLLDKGFMIRISYNAIGYELRAVEWGEHEYSWYDDKNKAIKEAFKLIK